MGTETLQIALLTILAGLLIVAMVTDWRRREIDNWLTITVAALAPIWLWASGYALWPEAVVQLGFCAVVFGIGVGLFSIGAMGGGDVKLLAALALWLPGLVLLKMLIVMSLLGGVLTIAMVAWHKIRRFEGQPEIPYGLAISAATLGILYERYFNQFA
jgi:prepilin peptidase CpaA